MKSDFKCCNSLALTRVEVPIEKWIFVSVVENVVAWFVTTLDITQLSNQVRMRIISWSIYDTTTSMSLALSICALCISLMQSINGTLLLYHYNLLVDLHLSRLEMLQFLKQGYIHHYNHYNHINVTLT